MGRPAGIIRRPASRKRNPSRSSGQSAWILFRKREGLFTFIRGARYRDAPDVSIAFSSGMTVQRMVM